MMKKLFLMVLVGVSLMARAADLNVWCSIPPLMSVARAVGGERVTVSCFMDGSQDPHSFSPSPKTVARAREADLFLTVGMPFETVVQERLRALSSGMQTLNLAQNVDHKGDMHVWLSLRLLSQMSAELEKVLSEIDPDGRAVYQSNLKQYQAKLDLAHQQLRERLEPLRGTSFYVYHPAFHHFAEDYGLRQKAVELDGKSPSPKQLLSLIRRAREENVKVIFVQPQFDRRPAQILAKKIGGRVVELNQLEADPVNVIQQAAQEIEHAVFQFKK
jgi:zinc transport system substrate-binding protein